MIDPSTLELLKEQYQKKFPFVIYSLPNSQEVTVILQNNNTLYDPKDFSERAFLFYPFYKNQKSYCIPKEFSKVRKQNLTLRELEPLTLAVKESLLEKKEYEALVSKALLFIKERHAQKVVVSRKTTFSISKIDFDVILYRLFLMYPSAFRYLWYHPETGIWCGITPELLLQTQEDCFSTMALAGTQKSYATQRTEWGDKEKDEHQLVVDDIVTKLQSVLSVLKVSKTYTYPAGPVVHLRTDITGSLKKGKTSLPEIASLLHPTSAVCGTPRKIAQKFIETHETYNREYYTGYLGPLKENTQESSIFVNLRCMKIEENHAHIFVGGGITVDSVPELEWLETQYKMQTMLTVLQPFL
ncbi:MAG: isochorismate synthase [Flavobacteriaceae bacterium]